MERLRLVIGFGFLVPFRNRRDEPHLSAVESVQELWVPTYWQLRTENRAVMLASVRFEKNLEAHLTSVNEMIDFKH